MMNRRQWLSLVAAAAGAAGLPLVGCATRTTFVSNPFALGVASGSPQPDGVVLWTRLAPESLPEGGTSREPVVVGWEVAEDEAFRKPVRRGQATALPALGHSVHVEVEGLEPDRWYHYRFTAGEAKSASGRTRTLPAPGTSATRLRLGQASCQRWEFGYYAAYRHMLAEDLDFVLFLGDYIYEYAAPARVVRGHNLPLAMTLADYRARYALYKSDMDLQRMHAACPWLVVWDDHEVQNDYAGLQGEDLAVAFPQRRAAAYQAYYENMPVRAREFAWVLSGWMAGTEMRIHDRVIFGDLAAIHLLDDRQYRAPQACPNPGRGGSRRIDPLACPEWGDPARSLLGAAQERWLDEGLATHGRAQRWNVLAQQTLLGQRQLRVQAGTVLWNDGWDGYPAARERLTQALQRHRVANTVVLGGDLHENWVGHVKADYGRPDSAALGVEFVGTSISSGSSGNADLAAELAQNPHFVFADTQRRGYNVIELTPRALSARLRVVDDATRADANVETLAAFTVQAGRPVLERN